MQERLLADPTLDVDVNRELQTSDLTIDDIQASIAIDLPKVWHDRFKAKANFKREKVDPTILRRIQVTQMTQMAQILLVQAPTRALTTAVTTVAVGW